MTTQHPTQPGWQPSGGFNATGTPPPDPQPPQPKRGWLHGLAILALAALGTIIGGMIGSAFVLLDYAVGTVLMLVGMWVGLSLGIWFGFWVTRPHPPIDPARYPNRVIRRR
jgi:hypothetical protein